jgi:hypothetical protein
MFKHDGKLLKQEALAWDWPGFNLMNRHVLSLVNGFALPGGHSGSGFRANRRVAVRSMVLTLLLAGGSPKSTIEGSFVDI